MCHAVRSGTGEMPKKQASRRDATLERRLNMDGPSSQTLHPLEHENERSRTMILQTRSVLAALLAVLGSFAVACGGSTSDDPTPGSSSGASTNQPGGSGGSGTGTGTSGGPEYRVTCGG